MKSGQSVRLVGLTLGISLVAFTGVLLSSPRGKVVSAGDDEPDSRIERGFEIAPVPLNLEGKNPALVGLGSYIVNAEADCNGCHSAGPPTEFALGHNPYLTGQTEQINPKTYLGGGRDFGPYPGPMSPVHIISRNLTPTPKTGLPEGDHTFDEFLEILRTGKDFDHLHPTCSAAVTTNCLPPPFNGDKLQIMPWPIQRNMTEHDIRAIYEYLKAIPCIQGNYPGEPADRCQP